MKLSPSILSANFLDLKKEIKFLESQNVDYIHLDIMDGMFVPNISFGFSIIKSIREITALPLDTHLMINEPERYIDKFINAGCDIINFHLEATQKHKEIISTIKTANKKVGMTIKPKTDYKKILPYIKDLDLALIMSVEPGFGGQKFLPDSLIKVKEIKKYAIQNNFNTEIQIDGGIKLDNVLDSIKAGADVIVVGSDIFANKDKESVIKKYYTIFDKYGGDLWER